MARMIDLIKQSAVPANVMRSAARGALALSAAEMVEILVYLTTNQVFAQLSLKVFTLLHLFGIQSVFELDDKARAVRNGVR